MRLIILCRDLDLDRSQESLEASKGRTDTGKHRHFLKDEVFNRFASLFHISRFTDNLSDRKGLRASC